MAVAQAELLRNQANLGLAQAMCELALAALTQVQEASEPGKINISQSTYDKVKDFFECTPRGEIPVKNIGSISMYPCHYAE